MTRPLRRRRIRHGTGTGAALMRAMLVVGPLALAVVVGIAPRSDRVVSGGDGIDMTMTGSVKPSSFSFTTGAPTQVGSCVRFGEFNQRGSC